MHTAAITHKHMRGVILTWYGTTGPNVHRIHTVTLIRFTHFEGDGVLLGLTELSMFISLAQCSSMRMKKHLMELPCTAGACPYDHVFACVPSSNFSFVIRMTLACPVDPTDPTLTPPYWPAHSSIESITLNQYKLKALWLRSFHFRFDHFFCLINTQ